MVNLSGVSAPQSILVADELTPIPTDEMVGESVLELEEDQSNDGREQIMVVLQQLQLGERELRFHSAFAIENTKQDFSLLAGKSGGVFEVDGSIAHLDPTVAANSATALKRDTNSPKVIDGNALKIPNKKLNSSGGVEVRSRAQSLMQEVPMEKLSRSGPIGHKDSFLSLPVSRKITSDELRDGQSAELNNASRAENGFAAIHLNLKSEDATLRPTMFQPIETMASDVQTDGTLLYKFRSWGHEHAVRIVPPALMSGDGSATFLQPSSALVEQRLNAYGGMTESGDRWQLQEYRDHTEERKEQRSQREREEDDA